jgi:hypothetical protein
MLERREEGTMAKKTNQSSDIVGKILRYVGAYVGALATAIKKFICGCDAKVSEPAPKPTPEAKHKPHLSVRKTLKSTKKKQSKPSPKSSTHKKKRARKKVAV